MDKLWMIDSVFLHLVLPGKSKDIANWNEISDQPEKYSSEVLPMQMLKGILFAMHLRMQLFIE